MRLALLLLLAADPGPTIRLRDEGGPAKAVREINCVGAGVTCSSSSTFGTLFVDGGAAGAPTDSTYITQTCNASLSAEQCLSANGTGIMISTTTTGVVSTYAGSTCGAGTKATAVGASGALTCSCVDPVNDICSSTPACADSLGLHLNFVSGAFACGSSQLHDVGGSSPQVQYNNAGVFGGIANVESDGTNMQMLAVTSAPAAPGANSTAFDFAADSGMPQEPWRIDAALGFAVPVNGLTPMFTSPLYPYQTVVQAGYVPDPIIAANVTLFPVGTGISLSLTGSSTSFGWDAGSPTRSQLWAVRSPGNVKQVWTGLRETVQWLWRQQGFRAWQRWGVFNVITPHAVSMMMGWEVTVGFPLGTAPDPSTLLNTLYFGCDSSATTGPTTTLDVCSNDGAGAATCAAVKAGWYCRDFEYAYDAWFWAAPNEAAVHWHVSRVGANGALDYADGVISSNLPQATARLSWHGMANSGQDAGAASTFVLGIGGVWAWVNHTTGSN